MGRLFRPEALEHREREWLGSVQLIRPVSFTVLTVLFVLTALTVTAYLAVGQYSRKARVTGYLVPDRGLIRLVSPQNAVVLENHVVEGASVHHGDVLFVLSVGPSTVGGDTQAAVQRSIESRVSSLKGESREQRLLEQTRLATIDLQVAAMAGELGSLSTEVGLQTQRLVLARQAQRQYEALRDQNFVSDAQVRSKAEEVLNVRAQLQGLERQRAAQSRNIASLQAQRAEIPLQAGAAKGAIDRDLAALAQQTAESEARQRIVVKAPSDGVVSGLLAVAGQSVTPAVPLATLLPAGAKLQAYLFAPSSAIGFVHPDQSVQLRYQAFPYQKFGHQTGEVVQVSRSPLQTSELASLPLADDVATRGEPLYRITVALDRQDLSAYGQTQSLAPGMQIDADVVLDRRRLIEWLFKPIFGVTGKV